MNKFARSTLFLRFCVFLTVVFAGTAADLGTKHWIFTRLGMPGEYLYPQQPQLRATWWMIDGVFGFQTSLNQGALFGIGQGKIALFVVFSVFAIAGILAWLSLFRGLHSRFLTVILGLITAGILGNLYDRLGLHGLKWNYPDELHDIGEPVYAVRDWILVMIGSWPWPNFNIADSLLVCGAILLGIFSLFFDTDSPFAGQRTKSPPPQAREG